MREKALKKTYCRKNWSGHCNGKYVRSRKHICAIKRHVNKATITTFVHIHRLY